MAPSVCAVAGLWQPLALLMGTAAGSSVPLAFSMPVAVGVCAMRNVASACRRRVGALDGVIPPSGTCEIAVRSGVMPKLQTTSVNSTENVLVWAKRSAFWT